MLYISGKAALNFSTASNIPQAQIFQEQTNALRKMWREDFIAITSNMKYNYPGAGVDKWFDRLSEAQDMFLKSKRSANINPVTYFSQYQSPSSDPSNPASGSADFIEFEEKPNAISHSVIGFKIRVCEKCLTTITLQLESNMEEGRINDIHKCDLNFLETAKKLDPVESYSDFLAKVNNFPGLLFQKCKIWARNTTGELYIIARRSEPLDEHERIQIPQNYKEIPWLKKLLADTKIKPTDQELYQFLCLAGNETTKLFTFKGKDATENLVYKIWVSNVPVPHN